MWNVIKNKNTRETCSPSFYDMKNIKTFEQFVNESYSVTEGAVKAFEYAMTNLINNIRRGYGWIDPDYVYDTVINDGEFGDFKWESIKKEVYQRLIDQNLLYFANNADPEVKGKKVSKLSELGLKESVNESFLAITGAVVLGALGVKGVMMAMDKIKSWKRQRTIAKAVKMQDQLPEKELKELIDEMHKEAMKELEKMRDYQSMAQVDKWQKECHRMIADGEITSAADVARNALSFEDTEVLESLLEGKDEYVNATLLDNFKDLRKGALVKINALDYTQGGDKDTIETIRPDGKKMEIKKAILTVKI